MATYLLLTHATKEDYHNEEVIFLKIMTVTKGKRKKEKVITLRMNNDSFDIIEEYAGAHGLSVNAFINSIIERIM